MADEKKLTPKQEAFALAYVETGNATEAYRRAYDVDGNARDSWIHVEACQLLNHPKVSLRLQELQKQAEELAFYTLRQASEDLEEARSKAMQKDQFSAAVSAITARTKLFGLDRPQKLEHTVHGEMIVNVTIGGDD